MRHASRCLAIVLVVGALAACSSGAPRAAPIRSSGTIAPATAPTTDGSAGDSLGLASVGDGPGLRLPTRGADDLRLPGVKETFNPKTCDLVVSIANEAIGFGFDSALISSEGQAVLDAVGKTLIGVPLITVRGYTSTEGDAEYNLALSLRRAQAVADVLGRDVRGATLDVHGEGEANPIVVPDDTEEKRAQNRRVEIHARVPSKECRGGS